MDKEKVAYGVYGSHTTESCPFNNKENRKLMLEIANTFEEEASARGINIISMYHSALEHTFVWILEATNAHRVKSLLEHTKVSQFNALKIVPVWRTIDAVNALKKLD